MTQLLSEKLFFRRLFALLGSSAAALLSRSAAFSLLHVAPLALVLAEAPLLQQPAALSLLHVRPWRRCYGSALAAAARSLVLADVDLLASFEQVCSVLAFFSAGAWVDCAEAVMRTG